MRIVPAVVAAMAAADPPGLFPARQQMALSLGWHIILACFGVAFPTMIFLAHRRGLAGDLVLARRWSKVSAVLFAIGAVSGTILSFEMGLLWPGLMGRFGDVLGLPFALEGISFFVEAIFLGIYLYGWDRLSPKVHLRTLLPVALAGVVGTFSVVSVNAWMNNPSGFRLTPTGEVTDVSPWAAMFNRGSFLQFLHLWVAAFMVVGFSTAGVYAVGMLRGRRDHRHRIGFLIPFAVASIAAVCQPFIGHLTGANLLHRQPAKLAAMELAPDAERRAPLRVGGILVDGRPRGAIEIPVLGSILAGNNPNAEVPGLADVPEDERPPVNLVHLSFQGMIAIGTALAGLAVLFWLARLRHRDLSQRRPFLLAAALAGPAAGLCVELGWVTTEVGRQPWIVWQVLRTRDAVSTSGGLWATYLGIVVLYTAMTVAAIWVLLSMSRRWREGAGTELPTPYGPAAAAAEEREEHHEREEGGERLVPTER
jgi:cytochrome d ubiquinol oxidase subunit I